MLEITMTRKVLGLRALDAHGEAQLCALPQDKPLKVRITQDRSSKHHRLFFAMLGVVAKGCGRDQDLILDCIKIATGHTAKFKYHGQWYEKPGSIAWDKMDQVRFNAFFEVACQVIEEEVGLKQPDLMRELQEQFPELFGAVYGVMR